MLPHIAPNGAIEPLFQSKSFISIILVFILHFYKICNVFILAHDAICFDGKSSGNVSIIDGIAGDEYPRTNPMQKNDMDTHSDRMVFEKKIK